MNLPEGINGGMISADFQNGLLEVTVQGGADHPEPERIQISSRTG
jgi:HSP20 family protein